MTRNEAMALAEQAGIEFQSHVGVLGRTNVTTHGSQSIKKIQRLIELAVAKEREACAQVCELMRTVPPNGEPEDVERGFNAALRRSAAAIRARGQKEGA